MEPVERRLEVTRTARYWTLGGTEAGEAWVVLHGYRQLARRFLTRFEGLADPGRQIVAPEALSRFYVGNEVGRHGSDSVVGATWMTREARLWEIRDYVRYLDRLGEALGLADRDVTVLGFSQGVATAVRWVTLGDVRPARLVLWGDFLPPDLDMERAVAALANTEVTLVRGTRDPSLEDRLAEDEARRIEAAGMSTEVVRYEGGHDIDEATLRLLAR